MSGLGPFSEADVLTAAAVLAASNPEDWVPGGDRREFAVTASVTMARLLAQAVRRTSAPDPAAHVLEQGPAEAYRLGWHDAMSERGPAAGHVPLQDVVQFVLDMRDRVLDAHELRRAPDPAGFIASRIGLHFDRLRGHGSPPPHLRFKPREQVEVMLAGAHSRPLTEHEESGAVPPADLSCERRARDLLLRMGIAGEFTGGDIVELADLFNARDELAQALEVAEAQLAAVRADRSEVAQEHRECREKVQAVRAALLGPDVPDPGHPPTAEMAKSLRLSYEQQVRRAAVQDTHVSDLRAEVNRLGGMLQHRSDDLTMAERRRTDDLDAIRLLMGEVAALQRAATDREVRTLRRCAEEIENGLRNGSVLPHEMLRNCAAWYRTQADSLEGMPVDRRALTLHGGGPDGGQAERFRGEASCPTCGSAQPNVVKAVRTGAPGSPFETCYDTWHGDANTEVRRVRAARPRDLQARTEGGEM